MKLIFTLILALLFLISCTPTDTGTTDNGKPESIKIGFMGPLTGDVSMWGEPAQKSVMLAVETVNADGGVNGVPIEVIYEDTMCSGKEAVGVMNKFVSVDKVKAVIGTLCSAASVPSYPIAAAGGVFMMAYGASNPDLSYDTPYFFRTFPSDALQAKVSAELALAEAHNI